MINAYLFLYNLLLFTILLLAFPLAWKKVRPDGKFPGDWKERLAVYGKERSLRMKERRNVWIHTVSIGEFLSVVPLVSELKKKENVVVTLATRTGRSVAESRFPEIIHLFFPVDLYPVTLRAVREINPKLIVIVETEIWPSLLKVASDKKIPVLLINGRLSPASFARYRRFRFFMRRFVKLFSAITMRSTQEAGRIVRLGASAGKVEVSGSMKFDLALSMGASINPGEVKKEHNIPEGRKVVVFGSIHPAEEEPVVEISRRLLASHPGTVLIIVPRYLDRTQVYGILESRKMGYSRKSRPGKEAGASILIVDTYGELNKFYSICDVAFVGASLCPFGGQNPIEPTAFGKPVLYGKYNWHFLEEWKVIKEGGGGIEVDSFEALHGEIVRLLDNPSLAEETGKKGHETLLANTGATKRNLLLLSRFM